MAGKDLDDLAKGLAEERISRGKALKRIGAALVGGLLAASPAAALAAPCPKPFKCGPICCRKPRPVCCHLGEGEFACLKKKESCPKRK